jgi:7-carboxy-7-deazaguanine synthase
MSDKKIPLVEMFGPTIQGEGAVIGQQTYFLRFGLCDYKCRMCDSMNAVDPKQVKANANYLTQEEILDVFMAFREPNTTRWVTFSGGNPCIHDLSDLVIGLKKEGIKIAVETQGTFAPEWLGSCDIVTCSPKGPGMGERTDIVVLDEFMHQGFQHFPRGLNIKVVIFDQRDLEFTKELFARYARYSLPFYLSLGNPYPPGYMVEHHPLDHADHMLELVKRYKHLFEDIQHDAILSTMRFLPQWHTFVWGNEKGK